MICLVTDRRRLGSDGDEGDRLVDLVAAAARAGIDLVQVRERDLEARPLAALAARCVDAVAGTRTKILINDRADVAIVARAHGVHLRGDSIGTAAVRSLVGPGVLVGRSAHDPDEVAEAAHGGGLDYLIFGTLHPTVSKTADHPITTLDALRTACRVAAGLPVLAIGGMTIDRAVAAARAGAAGIAGIGLFLPPEGVHVDAHLQSVVAGLRLVFDTVGVDP